MTPHKNHDDDNTIASRCCNTNSSRTHDHHNHKIDWILWGSILVLTITISLNTFAPIHSHYLHHFSHASLQILHSMWWGIAIGIVLVGMMSKMPREIFTSIMGKSDSIGGLFRAVLGGVVLDLCCHGILLVAAKLYERGVSLAQVVTFLIASPWNSLSLTLILIGLIGWQWTILYVLASMIIALTTGLIIQKLINNETLPKNPNQSESENLPAFKTEIKKLLKTVKFTPSGTLEIIKTGITEGKMIIKWLLFGTIIAASLRSFVPSDMFTEWLGPDVTGLLITLVIATIVEICSEGSAPIASEIVTNAKAPGNGFTFLMAGVATDYTEFMAIREFTSSWKIALAIPLITVPQVLLIGFIMNMASTGTG